MGRKSSRDWSVDADFTEAGESSGLRWLAEFGRPPFVWYSPDAVFGNILEPAVAGLVSGTHNGLEGALVEVESGIWVKSVIADGTLSVRFPYRSGVVDPVPVVPGRKLTVAGWARGASFRITVFWTGIDGADLGNSVGADLSHSVLTRVSWTLTPPPGAAGMEVRFVGASQVAGPTVSLTSSVTPYSPGKGCKRAVVHGLSEALVLVTSPASLSSFSFTVSEVG